MENNVYDKNVRVTVNDSYASPQQPQYTPPQQSPYIPPKKRDILGIIVVVIATIIIIGLAVFYYYAMTNPAMVLAPEPAVETPVIPPTPETPATKVINFSVPSVLPTEAKEGRCWVNSIAAPFRQDAWRCMVGNEISDPCFSLPSNDAAFCQPSPINPVSAFLIKPLTEPFPQPSLPPAVKDNWAWYLKLKDGTACSPFTGTLPLIDGQVAYYGCELKNNVPAPKITQNLVSFGHVSPTFPRTIDTVVIYSSFNAQGDPYDFNEVLRTYRASNVSPHYFIDRQGNVSQVVADKDIAYHAGKGKMPDGRTGINNFSIAVTLIYKDTEGPSEEQYLALSGLLQIFQGNYSIKNIVTRSQISQSGQKDPWNFDMAKVAGQEQAVILGELKKGSIWTATKAILTKNGTGWVLKSSEETNIETIWQ